MKPVPLVVPATSIQAATTAMLQTQRAELEALNEVYFQQRLYAGVVFYEGAAASTGNGLAIIMRFPDAASTTASLLVPTRRLWVGTRPRVDIYYTSPVGNTATFDFRFDVFSFVTGGNTTGSTLTVTWSAAGPAVANNIVKTQATITSARVPKSDAVRLRVVRFGVADANNNPLDVLVAKVTFEEVT